MHRTAAAAALLAGLLFANAAESLAGDLALDRRGASIEVDRPGGFARPRQVYLLRDGVPTTVQNPDATKSPRYVDEAMLGADAPALAVRIANGGAGAAGLIEAMAYAYLRAHPTGADGKPYAIAWYLTDTTFSVKALEQRVADIGITYDETLEKKALADGTAARRDLMFMDHFMVVGPSGNPAALAAGDTANAAFLKIADRGCTAPFTAPRADCAYFLSRDDLSATEIKERKIFDASFADSPAHAGLRDRAYLSDTKAPWYFKCPRQPIACFPPVALKRAHDDGLYTLTDLGTWLANGGAQGKLPNLRIFVTGVAPEGRPLLLNPANGLLSPEATADARAFYDWTLAPEGQAVIAAYGKDRFGEPLYRVR